MFKPRLSSQHKYLFLLTRTALHSTQSLYRKLSSYLSTMSSDAQDLATICDADRNRQTAQDVTKQVIGEMKSSLIFQYKWQDLLQAAPTSISSMGACFTASASTGNVHASIDPPVGGFKYLKYLSRTDSFQRPIIDACLDILLWTPT